MSPAGRKTPPDLMADRLWRLVGGSPREGRPYLPTEDGYQAITEWILREERVRPNRSRGRSPRPPYGPAVEPEPVEAPPWIEPEIAREPWREEDRRQRREAERRETESRRRQEERTPSEPRTVPPARVRPGEESPEPEPAPVETSPAPAKRKSRFKSLEL